MTFLGYFLQHVPFFFFFINYPITPRADWLINEKQKLDTKKGGLDRLLGKSELLLNIIFAKNLTFSMNLFLIDGVMVEWKGRAQGRSKDPIPIYILKSYPPKSESQRCWGAKHWKENPKIWRRICC